MDGLSFSKHATDETFRVYRDRPGPKTGNILVALVAMSRQSQKLTVDQTDVALLCTDETHRIGNYRIEHRLKLSGRACDDTEHLTCCCLLLQGLGEIAVADLKFLKQTNVFNRDHRLVGKGCYQLDLFICKRLDLSPKDDDNADRNSLS